MTSQPTVQQRLALSLFLSLFAAATLTGSAAPQPGFFEVNYAPSTNAGELAYGVLYRVWIPAGVKTLRGVVVHQHGCGEGACKAGETAADDLHWQALAKKWDCALLGPSYRQPEKASCSMWSDPRNGSEKTFLRALAELSSTSGHPELERVPWALWGHSGGANWVGTMLLLHPERIVGVWLRSGSPRLMSALETKAPPLDLPPAALAVPVMCNLGIKEKEGRFARIWETTEPFFRDVRSRGGLIGIAVDPRTSHECGDSRYLAIPFLDACLAQRLPAKAGVGGPLRSVNLKDAWLAAPKSDSAVPISKYTGDITMSTWLPNASVAKAWSEYTRTGATEDATPPAAPTNVRISPSGELTWDAEADFESGLAGFIIERDGQELAKLPSKPIGHFGRPLFQQMSYSDTPEQPLPAMRYVDTTAAPGKHRYRVISINSVGLRSKPSAAVTRESNEERR